MEKENFLGKLRKLVELAKSKQNALDVTEINNFFMGDNLQTEQMEQIYSFLEEKNIDVVPVIDDAALAEYHRCPAESDCLYTSRALSAQKHIHAPNSRRHPAAK